MGRGCEQQRWKYQMWEKNAFFSSQVLDYAAFVDIAECVCFHKLCWVKISELNVYPQQAFYCTSGFQHLFTGGALKFSNAVPG